MPNPELTAEVKKLRSDIETLKSLVFSNDNRFKTHAVDLIFLKANVVNKGNAKNPVKFLREDRTWATVNSGIIPSSKMTMWQQIDGDVFLMQSADNGTTWFKAGIGEFDLDWPPAGDSVLGVTGNTIPGGTSTQLTAWWLADDGNVYLLQSIDNGTTWFKSGIGEFDLTWPI